MGGDGHDETFTESSTKNGATDSNLPTNSESHAPTNGTTRTGSDTPEGGSEEEQRVDNVFPVTITLPHQPYKVSIMVSTQEQVQDLRQSVMEAPASFQYSCFHLEHATKRINDFIELSDVDGFGAGSTLRLVEDPYTEKEARLHLLRTREIIGAATEKTDGVYGITAGLSLHDTVCPWKAPEGKPPSNRAAQVAGISGNAHALDEYKIDGSPALQTLLPAIPELAPKTIKLIGLSAWNPPPIFLRHKGHLLYLQLTTNEGEQYHITSHVSGFFVNKSSNSKFDPFPRLAPKNAFAHSLFALISTLSPSFLKTFENLQEVNNKRDPLANFQLSNATPSSPWLVASSATNLSHHQSDLTRTQEAYLIAGADNTETLRDWNEEIQNVKEMARDSVQDRVFRERLMSKVYAEFNDAAVRGAALVARGEIPALNPTEARDAQIFVYNNIFYSYGADGVGTFTSEGGDEAARVAVGKDVAGVKAVNQLDIDKLATAATIVVDYLGKRLVAQSIVPGIFKQRDPDENQVDYGGVEGRDVIADNDAFVPMFSQLSKELRVKKHVVWDKEGKEHVLEASVETKGLLGTDGRKYILDLYRLTPIDISWLEGQGTYSPEGANQTEGPNYPHRMTVLRSELIDMYWRLKLGEYVQSQVGSRKELSPEKTGTSIDRANETTDAIHETTAHHEKTLEVNGHAESDGQEHVDISAFSLAFNPDVFCGQVPQTVEQTEEWTRDEEDVRKLCRHLHDKALPDLIHDLKEGEVGFPMDGASLSALMHKRGINVRYLGRLADLTQDNDARMAALRALATQEMISRAFKHIANRYVKDVPVIFVTSCFAHLLNCLLGSEVNSAPKVQLDEDLRSTYVEADYTFTDVTPESLQTEIRHQVGIRYRSNLSDNWVREIRCLQLLRSVAMKLGLQMVQKDFAFSTPTAANGEQAAPLLNGKASEGDLSGRTHANGNSNGHAKHGKKKKKNAGRSSPTLSAGSESLAPDSVFSPDDIANIVPVIKDSCPKSKLAEEALEAGKISMMQNQKEIGQELLLESLTLHEQIYGILHPEVARVYHQLAMLYYQLDEKNAAIELAHKAVIISERTLGIDSSETILAYLNLALFEHGNRNTTVAIACVRHALELWKIVYGDKHPDSITTLNNAAVMLQHLQSYKESRLWFETSLSISEEISGKQSVSTATLLFQLAQALVLDGDHNGAVHRMREAYSVFLAKLGKDDPNTKESEKWLEQLTQNAVSMAKHAKDVQARRTRRSIMLHPRSTNLGGAHQHSPPQIVQSAPPSSASANLLTGNDVRGSSRGAGGGLDSRNIEELIKFIEGGAQTAKRVSPKKRTTTTTAGRGHGHPRRRGGSTVGASA